MNNQRTQAEWTDLENRVWWYIHGKMEGKK